jgi:hypothetical protein
MIKNLPVLIIAFDRPNKLKNLLYTCYESGIRIFYIAIDGSLKNNIHRNELFETTITEFQSRNPVILKVWNRKNNLGLALSVVTAIDWFFSYESSGIILEDDLEIRKNSIDFFKNSLEFFDARKDVLLVSGNQFFTNIEPQNGISVCNYPLIWGWATWKDRWLGFRESLMSPLQPHKAENLSKKVKYFLITSYSRALSTEINSWAILFATYSRFNNFLCICPNVNLVSNIGFDHSAVHTKSKSWPLNLEISELVVNDYSLDMNSSLNKLIERDVYKIKNRHVFFKIKNFLIRKPLISQSKLNTKLQQVIIPK